MFDHWLEPTTHTSIADASHSWAKNISFYQGGGSLNPKQCVLIGLDATAADAVREMPKIVDTIIKGN